MNTEHIINAWRDEEYRESLDDEQRAALPESPVGPIDLSEDELEEVDGGSNTVVLTIATEILTHASFQYCESIAHGGSCAVGTDGCC